MGQGEGRSHEVEGHGAGGRARLATSPRPFGETVVAEWHLERPETARVLAELERRVARSRQTGALVGPPGLGRTHLLHVLASRVDPTKLQCVYLPQACFDFLDLCRFCVGRATGRRSVDEPDEAMRRLLHELWKEGRSLLVLVDDADSMPPDCAAAWLDFTHQQVPSMLSLFVTRDDEIAPCLAALADDAPIIRFTSPMSESETCDYVLDRLARVGATPEILDQFGEAVVEQLHALSGGRPVPLHGFAQVYLDLAARSPETARAWLASMITADRDADDESVPADGAIRVRRSA